MELAQCRGRRAGWHPLQHALRRAAQTLVTAAGRDCTRIYYVGILEPGRGGGVQTREGKAELNLWWLDVFHREPQQGTDYQSNQSTKKPIPQSRADRATTANTHSDASSQA